MLGCFQTNKLCSLFPNELSASSKLSVSHEHRCNLHSICNYDNYSYLEILRWGLLGMEARRLRGAVTRVCCPSTAYSSRCSTISSASCAEPRRTSSESTSSLLAPCLTTAWTHPGSLFSSILSITSAAIGFLCRSLSSLSTRYLEQCSINCPRGPFETSYLSSSMPFSV